jgi:hypothetical protein
MFLGVRFGIQLGLVRPSVPFHWLTLPVFVPPRFGVVAFDFGFP